MKVYKGLGINYLKYWVASAFSMAASNILQYVLSLYVLEITGSATLFASMLSIVVFPRIFLTPFSGVIADRYSKIKIMSAVVLFESAVLFVYFALGFFISIPLIGIFVLVVILEMGEVFYNGPEAAILPELVEKDRIKDAISLSKIDDGIVVVASPLIAALLYENVTIYQAFLAVGILDFFTFVIQSTIKTRSEGESINDAPANEVPPEHSSEKAAGHQQEQEEGKRRASSVWTEMKEGFDFIMTDSFYRVFVKILPLVNACFGATFSVSVMYLFLQSFNIGTYMYGIYCAVTSSMSIIVPIIILPLFHKWNIEKVFRNATALIGLEILAIALVAYLGVNEILPVAACVILITVLDCMTIAEAIPMQLSSSTLIQTKVDEKLLGRVTSVIRMLTIAGVALGEFVFGIINDLTVVWFPMIIGGAGVLISAAFFAAYLKKNEGDDSP